jgi:tetratricopeptide (TPR) repeat protein
VPYLRTGRLDEAADAHRRAYRLQRHKLADLSDLGAHVDFCARTGNEHRGLEILQRHLDWLEKAPSPAAEMRFAAAGALLLRRLTAIGHGDTAVRVDRDDIPARKLADDLAARATEISLRFDARNGTDTQSRRNAERLAAEPFDVVLPLSPTARRAVVQPAPAAEPEPEIPAGADAETLLELAAEQHRQERDAAVAATLAAFDARFPDAGVLDPVLAARREALRGGQLWESDHAAATRAWERAIEQFSAAGSEGEASILRGRLGIALCAEDRFDEGRALIERDIAYQEEHGVPRDRAAAWARLSNLYFMQDRLADANRTQDRADALATEAGEPRLAALCALRRAVYRAAVGRSDEALAAAGEAREFYRAHGPADRLGEAAVVFGQLTDDPAEAVAAFGETLACGLAGPALTARVGRARALMQLDRAAEAVPDLVEAVALSAELGLDEAGAFCRQDLANAYRLADRTIEAAEVAEEALSMFQQVGLEEPANDARLLLAGLYRQLGENDGALALYRDLLDRLTGNPAGLGQVGEQYGQLLFDIDRDAEAADAFRAAADQLREAEDLTGELRLLRRRLTALHYADEVEQAEDTIRLAEQRYASLPDDLSGEPPMIWSRAMFGFEAARLLMSRGRHAEAIPHVKDWAGPLRKVGAGDDADLVEGMYANALLASGSPAEAEALLRPLLGAMRPDAPTRANAAEVLATALDELGRAAEATALRSREGLNAR